MSPRCLAEVCRYWTGDGCACRVLHLTETRPVCDRCGVTRTPGSLTCPCPEWDVRPDAPPVALTITRPHDADTPTG